MKKKDKAFWGLLISAMILLAGGIIYIVGILRIAECILWFILILFYLWVGKTLLGIKVPIIDK